MHKVRSHSGITTFSRSAKVVVPKSSFGSVGALSLKRNVGLSQSLNFTKRRVSTGLKRKKALNKASDQAKSEHISPRNHIQENLETRPLTSQEKAHFRNDQSSESDEFMKTSFKEKESLFQQNIDDRQRQLNEKSGFKPVQFKEKVENKPSQLNENIEFIPHSFIDGFENDDHNAHEMKDNNEANTDEPEPKKIKPCFQESVFLKPRPSGAFLTAKLEKQQNEKMETIKPIMQSLVEENILKIKQDEKEHENKTLEHENIKNNCSIDDPTTNLNENDDNESDGHESMELNLNPNDEIENDSLNIIADLDENDDNSEDEIITDPTIARLPKFIQMALEDTRYHYSCIETPEDSPNMIPSEAIDSIIYIVTKGECKDTLNKRLFRGIVKMIKKHIFHRFPNIANIYVIGESMIPFFINNYYRLSRVYFLLNSLIPAVGAYIDENTLYRIVSLLESPCESEQNCVLKTIENFCMFIPHINDMIFPVMLKALNAFRDGCLLHTCVSPILIFLQNYLCEVNQPFDRSYFISFRSTVFPLIISPTIVDFYGQFYQYSQLFQSRDSTTAVWCIRFLFRHWPATNSHKQCIFLHQVQTCLAALDPIFLPALANALFDKIKESLVSINFKVALTAIGIISDEDFIKVLYNSTGAEVADLLHFLKSMENHWNIDVKMAAKEAENMIEKLNINIPQPRHKLKTASQTKVCWRKILKSAASHDHSIDAKTIDASISAL